MAKKKTQPIDELPYEKVVAQLSETVERLEEGELPLEEQLEAFESGVKLVRRGQSLLDQAERKVEKLLASGETERLDGDEADEA